VRRGERGGGGGKVEREGEQEGEERKGKRRWKEVRE
jgi:hypothetical protein